jgi:hypothetical protein
VSIFDSRKVIGGDLKAIREKFIHPILQFHLPYGCVSS